MSLLTRRTLLLSGAATALAAPTLAQTTTVGPADLPAALAAARGGETLVLADGDYGAVDIAGKTYADFVTLRPARPGGAVLQKLDIRGSRFVRCDGLHVSSPDNGARFSTVVAVTEGSRDVQIINCTVNGRIDTDYSGHYGLYTNDQVRDVLFAGNFVHHVRVGGTFYNAQGLTVSGNVIDHTGGDSFKFIAVRDVLIENNFGARHIFSAPGEHNDFIQFQGADSANIVIRGNVSLPRSISNVQGIFLDDARYSNVLIEYNIIVTSMIRGISVSDCANCEARFNTLINIPGIGSKATKVMGFSNYHSNIETSYLQDAKQGPNLTLQNTHPGKPLYFGQFFNNPQAGQAMRPADLLPVRGSLAERYGAVGTIQRFMGN